MPLMMEDESYMEELFGDSEPVHIPTMTPPIKGLAQRIDELHESGCCHHHFVKIAWSKSGCVASITPDGRGVNLRPFFRNSSDGKWILGEEIPLKLPQAHEDFPFVHISWGHIGTDLAVLDAAGRIFVFTSIFALGRMVMTRAPAMDQEDEMGAVIGMHWLSIIPHHSKSQIAWSASHGGNGWGFNISSHAFNDAHHPLDSKAALICVGRNGILRLRFQQPDNSWQETSIELEHMSSSREPFTHAAFASNNDDSLLLAAHDVIGHLHLYRVQIHWQASQPQKQGQPPRPIAPPTLEATNLMIEDSCYPASPASADGSLTTGQEQRAHIPAQLTHLSFLPTTPEQHAGTLPTILAIFSHCPSPISPLDQTQPPQNSFSIIARWEVHQPQQNHLHPSVDLVASKKKSASSQSFRLRRLSDMPTNSLVLSLFPVWYNMILVLCQSDGSIEFRNRASMDVITADYIQDKVSTLPQAGFAFSTAEPTLHIALSANHCVAAAMQSDGSVKLKSMEYTHGSLNSSEDDPKHGAAIAALVLQHTSACNQYLTSDDIFAIMNQDISDARKRTFVSQALQALNVNLDCVSEDAHGNAMALLSRSPQFIKCLSAQNLLGYPGNSQRSLSSKLAWAVLNIRYATQIMSLVMRTHGQIDKNPLRPEWAPLLVGLCRWMLHFMIWMLDEIIALGHSLRNTNFDRAALQAKLNETSSPALIILLSSFSRIMLGIWQRPLIWISKTAAGFANTAPTLELRRTYTPVHTMFLECPFDWRLFEWLVSETNHLVRTSYQKAGVSDGHRAQMERDMMLGEIPEALMPAAHHLLTAVLFKDGGFLDRIDPAKIMFFDTRWLGLDNSMRTAAFFKAHKVDVCQKIVLKPHAKGEGEEGEGGGEMKLRRCTRCSEYMEDFSSGQGQGQGHMNWLMGWAKHCVCSNAWMIAEEKV
ncbi:hypothetical protein AOQ84DRAFT_443946 [Glonium stellatum]|uniref:Mediator of RNA polymerase II transcription subunit 16 n=1 Tax=Glonium stellatum TaxID=574774 RepID=A0A8E2JLH8_9PEZI|nr:hypothetical protein AOQ84DRAFT_443946 [Glonium stellatum]